MTSRFFRTADTNALHPHRRDQLERMAESMLKFADEEALGHDFAIDIPHDDEMLWEDWERENKNKGKGIDAFEEVSAGSLDLLGLLVQEGIESDKVRNFYGFDRFTLSQELAQKGFHHIHFRMDFPNFSDRLFYTDLVSGFKESSSELDALSLSTASDAEGDVNGCDIDVDSPFFGLSKEDLYTLFRLESRKAPAWTREVFYSVVDKYFEAMLVAHDHLIEPLAPSLEEAFRHLVYNFGYRLKLMGFDNQTIIDEISPTIDYLLLKITDEKPFSEGLKRQIFINLFSAFPSGLQLFDTNAGDLAGLNKDNRVLKHPLYVQFLETFRGPISLFDSSGYDNYESPGIGNMLKFFREAGYEVDYDLTSGGILPPFSQMLVLYASKHPLASVMSSKGEILASGEGSFRSAGIKTSFLDENILSQYPQEVSEGIIISCAGVLNDLPVGKNLKGFKNYLNDNFELKSSVMKILAEKKILNYSTFSAMGGSIADLKRLGDLAPKEIRENHLSADLGI